MNVNFKWRMRSQKKISSSKNNEISAMPKHTFSNRTNCSLSIFSLHYLLRTVSTIFFFNRYTFFLFLFEKKDALFLLIRWVFNFGSAKSIRHICCLRAEGKTKQIWNSIYSTFCLSKCQKEHFSVYFSSFSTERILFCNSDWFDWRRIVWVRKKRFHLFVKLNETIG